LISCWRSRLLLQPGKVEKEKSNFARGKILQWSCFEETKTQTANQEFFGFFFSRNSRASDN
jgi:hypothetical protein